MGLEPLLPQINMTEQSESLCKRQIIFENHPEPTLGFDIGTEWIQSFFGRCQFISRFIF